MNKKLITLKQFTDGLKRVRTEGISPKYVFASYESTMSKPNPILTGKVAQEFCKNINHGKISKKQQMFLRECVELLETTKMPDKKYCEDCQMKEAVDCLNFYELGIKKVTDMKSQLKKSNDLLFELLKYEHSQSMRIKDKDDWRGFSNQTVIDNKLSPALMVICEYLTNEEYLEKVSNRIYKVIK